LTTSVTACEKLVKCLVVPDTSPNALKAMSSRWKKIRNIDMEAPVAQVWPEVVCPILNAVATGLGPGPYNVARVARNRRMGLQYAYFTAEDDEAAAAAFALGSWPLPTYPTKDIGLTEDIRLDDLADLEGLLTGQSVQEITADPRCYAKIATDFDEGAGVDLCGIMSVTDTFTRALAAAELSTLRSICRHYYGNDDHSVGVMRELAAVAQHAVARGHHMYSFWVV